MRALAPGQAPRLPRGGTLPMGPSFYRHPGDVAAGPSGAPERNSVEPIDPFRWASGQDSQYRGERPDTLPAVLRDVDIGTNFFSPFQPILPFAPLTGNYAREFDYPVGYNLDYQPRRFQLMAQLRAMSQSWGLLRSVIERRKDQLLVVPWDIQARAGEKAPEGRIARVKEFFRRPDLKRNFSQWARLLLEDLFVIDAPTIYVWRKENGRDVHALEVLDGATVLPLIDDAGRRPDWPQAAFQQIIKGLPSIDLTERDILYAPMRPRPELPVYGYSPVEQIYLEATEGIRRTLYQVSFWSEGSMPELMITVPDNWAPQQIAMFQAAFDSLLDGNAANKSKVRFIPGGMKPFDIKNANGEALKSEYDEWLARLVCFTFGVNPQPFVAQMNRATAQVSQEVAAEEGTAALQAWFKGEVMDPLIQITLDQPDLEFVWQTKAEQDPLERAQAAASDLKMGVRTINEVRDEMGLEPVQGGDRVMIYTSKGAVPLEAMVAPGTAEAPEDAGEAE